MPNGFLESKLVYLHLVRVRQLPCVLKRSRCPFRPEYTGAEGFIRNDQPLSYLSVSDLRSRVAAACVTLRGERGSVSSGDFSKLSNSLVSRVAAKYHNP
jgi:hypothetical protein